MEQHKSLSRTAEETARVRGSRAAIPRPLLTIESPGLRLAPSSRGPKGPYGIRSFSPGDLRRSSEPVLGWLAATGCTRVAIHFDVDTIDSDEIVLGLGAEPRGLSSAEVRRIVTDVKASADVVGFTIAECFPRQVMHLRQILEGFPLIGDRSTK